METATKIPIVEGFNLTSKILNMRLDNFYLIPITTDEIKKIDKEKVTFEFHVEGTFNMPEKKCSISITSKIFMEEAKSNLLGEIKTSGEFRIENLDDILKRFNGVPQVVTGTYLGIVLGAMRGMFILKSEGTYLHGVMMPVVNIESFFTPPQPQVLPKK